MKKITFCIPSKNNLRYLKSCIASIRENSTIPHDIIVYVDANKDNTTDWLEEQGINFVLNTDSIPKGIAYAYNRCIELAETEIVCMFHADMYMARGFDTGILKHLNRGNVVAATRIEPPLHPEGKEKIVKNFGFYPEDFNRVEFDSYVGTLITKNLDVITKGMFAPWAIYKDDIMAINMHDESFHSYHEDSDIFNRFILNKYTLIQSWEAFVYHLTCRGGQFQDGVEKITSDEMFHKMKNESFFKFIRKWGSAIMNDEFHHPIVYPKYNLQFIVTNVSNASLVSQIEPFCSRLVIDNKQIFELLSSTSDEVKNKIALSNVEFDVSVYINQLKLTQEDFNNLVRLNGILSQLDESETGTFELGNLTVEVSKLENQNGKLIYAS